MLTIYRASAGAGKTYRLTGDYLLLLFAHPTAYRRILAVTFTNKATDEMKVRIVEALYELANGLSDDYIDSLCSAYTLTKEQVKRQAQRILISILHDYSSFHISTIDRFFQQTMRAFTREIGLQGGYGIEMDQELVLTETIDRLLANLEKEENKELLGWLLRFAEDKVESGGEWNLRREMMSLSREIFKENFKAFNKDIQLAISNKERLQDYKKALHAIIQAVESDVKRLGAEGLAIIERFGLTPVDFNGKGRSPLTLLERWAKGEMKPPTATFLKLADNPDAYMKKTDPPALKHIISCAYNEGLNLSVRKIIERFENLSDYYTAKEILKYYYTLGILTDVNRQLALYREEKNIMLIADTTELLHKIIAGSDTPFIYEKTGTTIDHYMIDEFQDTSRMQWDNFRPLINESLAHKQANLIVGDVKQSIYRFRNSDWKLLDEQIGYDFSSDQLQEETLKENWRSCRHVVEFNNTLFTHLPILLQALFNEAVDESSLDAEEIERFSTRILRAYAHSAQQVAPPFQHKAGHVCVDFIERDDEKDWKEYALEKLPPLLQRLQDNGYTLKDIAILTRTNREGAMVADTLLAYREANPSDRYRYDIISDDSLFVGSSASVRFLIDVMRFLRNPSEKAFEERARFAWLLNIKGGEEADEVADFPPDIKAEMLMLCHRSLYEMVEGVYQLFAPYFPDNEQAFLQAFFDMVSEYAQKENTDVNLFLHWWDDAGNKKAIATPDNQNAIRVMTIHKSKGLGFKVVILPFGDWELDHKPMKTVILWCQPLKPPFNQLQLVPVRYSSLLAQTCFAADYFHEKLHVFIDNLNTLYVAATRVKEELIIFSPRPKKLTESTLEVEKITSISELLWAGLTAAVDESREDNLPIIALNKTFDREEGCFELGEWWRPSAPKHSDDSSSSAEIPAGKLVSVAFDNRLKLRLQGRDFCIDDPRRKHGILMHTILSRIETVNDIEKAVESYRKEGVIDLKEKDAIIQLLRQRIQQNEKTSSWFDGTYRVVNEVEIIDNDGSSLRPDRVMFANHKAVIVDYKFGEKEDPRYRSQLKKYVQKVKKMGYVDVESYLWYVELDKIEEHFL
ncbi:UvrD-helicase domain-containing protein [Parabacteroides sp. OttesenSCG-928-N08]|nr:UvrD-helicase domain-containing protein [Parabacteroides sp. OttesenSCG-928-N08]